MSQSFPKPNEPFGGDINVKIDLSYHAIKTDVKKFRIVILQFLH